MTRRRLFGLGAAIGTPILLFLLYFTREFFAGPIGEFGRSVLEAGWKFLSEVDPTPRWALQVALLFSLLLLIAIGLLIWLVRREHSYGTRMKELTDLQDRMRLSLVLTASLSSTLNLEAALETFLAESMEVLNKDVCRPMIMRPDPSDASKLRMWVAPEHSANSTKRTVLYIGGTGHHPDRGVAGASYTDGNMRLAKIIQDKNKAEFSVYTLRFSNTLRKWISSPDPQVKYKSFHSLERSRSYQSFVTIPVTRTPALSSDPTARYNPSDCLAVLCYEGKTPNTFSHRGEFEVLWALASQLAATIILYEHLITCANPIALPSNPVSARANRARGTAAKSSRGRKGSNSGNNLAQSAISDTTTT